MAITPEQSGRTSMSKENLRRDIGKSFPIEIKTRVHIRDAHADALRKSWDGLYSPESTLTQLQRRVSQSGGRFGFDISELPIEMQEAAFFTWARQPMLLRAIPDTDIRQFGLLHGGFSQITTFRQFRQCFEERIFRPK
jgi:hypothetical protein